MPDRPAGLIRGSLVSLAVRCLDLPSRYGFHLLVAAGLGVEEAGRFYIVFSLLTALGGLGRLGIDRALTRQIAISLAEGKPDEVRAVLCRCLWLATSVSVLVSLGLALMAPLLAIHVLGKPSLAGPLMLGALAILPQNLGAVAAGGLAGLQRIGLSQMIYSWLWPACFCLIALVTGVTLEGALCLIAASFAVAALVGGVLLFRSLPAKERRRPASAPVPALLRPALSLFTLEMSQLTVAAAPALILGILASSREVGLFALAWRIALLVNIVVSAVAAMASPRFAALHAGSDGPGLGRAAGQAVGLCLLLSIIPVLAMLVCPALLLGMIGSGYADGANVLRILAVGQLAAAASAAMPELLGMTGHMAELRRLNFLSMALLLGGAAILGAAWGATGAAMAVSLSLGLGGIGAQILAYRRLGVAPWRYLFSMSFCRSGRRG